MRKKAAWLYYLCDPDTGAVRYVGWTSKTPQRRLVEHISDARHGMKGHRCNWLRSLLSAGLVPIIRPCLIAPATDAPHIERLLIAMWRRAGAKLVNGTDGGEGVLGLRPPWTGKKRGPMSEEQRRKLSVALRGRKHTAEARAKITAAQTGRKRAPFTDEHRHNLSVAHRKKEEGCNASSL